MLQKYHKTTRVRCGGNYLQYTGPMYTPNQRINTAQKETHSKILPSPTYIEITKNSIGLTPPFTSAWPHLRCDVGLEEGEYRENCLCLAVLCIIITVHKDTSSSYRSVNCIGL